MDVTIILGLSIFVQLAAVCFALWLIRITGRWVACLAIAVALLLMVFRRSISLALILSGDATHIPDLAAEIVALAISILMLLGVAGIAPLFLAIKRSRNDTLQSQQKLLESEAQFRTLYENTTIGLYRTTPDGKILLANPALVSMLGYWFFEELAERNLEAEGFEPDYPRSRFRELIERDGEIIGLESAWKRQDGSTVFVRESAKAVRDAEGNTLQYEGTVEDITERKLAEDALKESEERLRCVFEGSRDALFIADENSRFFSTNKAASELTGYTLEELSEMSIPDLHDSEGLVAYREFFGRIMSGESVLTEAKIRRKDGTKVDTEFSNSRIEIGGHVYMLSAARDVSERKQAEEALRESEERYKTLSEVAIEGLLLHDDGVAVEVNLAFVQMFGYEVKELIGENVIDILVLPEYKDLIIKNIASGFDKPYEITARRKDGTTFPVMIEAARIIRYKGRTLRIASVRDISEQVLAEDKLRFLSSAIEQSTEGLAVVDLEGNLQFVNDAFAAMHGYTLDELAGEHLSIFHTPEQMPSVEKANRQIQETGEFSGEILHVRRDGTAFPTLMQNSLLRDDKGKLIGMVGAARDITERKRAEEALQRSEELQRTLLKTSPDFIFVLDADSTIKKVNRLHPGHREEDIVGQRASMFVPPEYRDTFERAVRQAADTRQLQAVETMVDLPDGRHYFLNRLNPVPLTGVEGSVVLIATDITERKRAEEALRESEERFRAIFETARDSIFIKDLALKYTQVNPAMERLFDLPAAELIGKTDEELFGKEAGEHLREVDSRVLAGEIVEEEHTQPVRGVPTAFNVIKFPLRNSLGEIYGLYGIARDIIGRTREREGCRK